MMKGGQKKWMRNKGREMRDAEKKRMARCYQRRLKERKRIKGVL